MDRFYMRLQQVAPQLSSQQACQLLTALGTLRQQPALALLDALYMQAAAGVEAYSTRQLVAALTAAAALTVHRVEDVLGSSATATSSSASTRSAEGGTAFTSISTSISSSSSSSSSTSTGNCNWSSEGSSTVAGVDSGMALRQVTCQSAAPSGPVLQCWLQELGRGGRLSELTGQELAALAGGLVGLQQQPPVPFLDE